MVKYVYQVYDNQKKVSSENQLVVSAYGAIMSPEIAVEEAGVVAAVDSSLDIEDCHLVALQLEAFVDNAFVFLHDVWLVYLVAAVVIGMMLGKDA